MSVLQVANIHFESTGAYYIDLSANNVARVYAKGFQIPGTTTATRQNDGAGTIVYNSDTGQVEIFAGGSWQALANNLVSNVAYTLANAAYTQANTAIAQTAIAFAQANANVANLQTALDTKLASSAYTASDVLSKLLTVDGNGSGLDADKVRGTTPSTFGLARLSDADAAAARSGLGLGSAAELNVGTGANNVVQLNSSGYLPAVDGRNLTNLPGGGILDVQTFDSSGTWTKPASGTWARIQVWGGGGGGSRQAAAGYGGGGGGYAEVTVLLSSLSSSVAVTVGTGGAGRTGSTSSGGAGGSSMFGSYISAQGGDGGTNSAAAMGGDPYEGYTIKVYYDGTNYYSLGNFWRGGGQLAGPASVYWGGGRGWSIGGSYGTSVWGGNGASSGGGTGTAPGGGGGGGASANANGGNGAGGRVIVTVW